MNIIRSQIFIENGDKHKFIQFIMDYLRYDKSPFLPLFISYKAAYYQAENPLDYFYDWRVSKYSNKPKSEIVELSSIHLSEYPDCLAVQFQYSDTLQSNIQNYILNVGKLLKKYGFKISYDNVKKDDVEILVPITDAAFERWIDIYEKCKELQRQYLEEWREGNTKKSKPTMADYVEYIQSETGDKFDKKTIQRILKAGKNGLLD